MECLRCRRCRRCVVFVRRSAHGFLPVTTSTSAPAFRLFQVHHEIKSSDLRARNIRRLYHTHRHARIQYRYLAPLNVSQFSRHTHTHTEIRQRIGKFQMIDDPNAHTRAHTHLTCLWRGRRGLYINYAEHTSEIRTREAPDTPRIDVRVCRMLTCIY